MPLTHPLRFGIKIAPHHVTYAEILRVFEEADEVPILQHGWDFDHFYPISGLDPTGPCLEGWTLLAALAARTKRIRLGVMVTGNTYRHPAVLANMGATVDIIADGRLDFGIGAAWNEQEHAAYGIPMPPPGERIRRLGEACAIIQSLWTTPETTFAGRYYQLKDARCEPKPVQRPYPPFVIGGGGEQLTLKIVAKYADIWNHVGGGVEAFRHKSAVLDEHCRAIGRDPAAIERSIQAPLDPANPAALRDLMRAHIQAGATHLVVTVRPPFAPDIAHQIAREIAEPLTAEFA